MASAVTSRVVKPHRIVAETDCRCRTIANDTELLIVRNRIPQHRS